MSKPMIPYPRRPTAMEIAGLVLGVAGGASPATIGLRKLATFLAYNHGERGAEATLQRLILDAVEKSKEMGP